MVATSDRTRLFGQPACRKDASRVGASRTGQENRQPGLVGIIWPKTLRIVHGRDFRSDASFRPAGLPKRRVQGGRFTNGSGKSAARSCWHNLAENAAYCTWSRLPIGRVFSASRLAEKTRPGWALHERVRKIGSPVLLA